MKKAIYLLLFILFITFTSQGQIKFRSGTFFHHSTGLCIWGPNGSSTSVPLQMNAYNTLHGYTGTNAVTLTELWFPEEDDNEWCRWHRIFENQDTAHILPYLSVNKLIIIKSCFPSSNIEAYGETSDTLYPDYKTVLNYKWHWRHILKIMRSHPQNFFVIWTNAPLVQNQTNTSEALLAHSFCKWAKDTLAAGLDPVFGTFPQNVYVFDFFHKLAGTNYMLPLAYATGADDSHPNAAATTLVAPQFVNETFNASIYYETHYGIIKISEVIPETYNLSQNFPNPFNPNTTIKFRVKTNGIVKLTVYDILGKEISVLINEKLAPGEYKVTFDGNGLASGIYYYKMEADNVSLIKKMALLK